MTVLQLWSMLLICSQIPALAATVVDFDSLSDSEIVTNQFAGLTFQNTIALTAGVSLNEFEFLPRSGSNVVSDNGGPITIGFTGPVLSFAGYFTYLVPLTITAFDSGDSQVGRAVSRFSNNLVLSGDPGSSPNEFLQVAFAAGISRVTITGDTLGNSFALDDVAFERANLNVPEPPLIFLFLTALGALFGFRK